MKKDVIDLVVDKEEIEKIENLIEILKEAEKINLELNKFGVQLLAVKYDKIDEAIK